MPHAMSSGARLYYEEAGSGTPLLFAHEFGGDLHSWEPQLRFFSRRYRCIAFNARGWPPSEVRNEPELNTEDHAARDIVAVLRHLGIDRAHLVGLSMGAHATLLAAIRTPEIALSATIAGLGYGADADTREQFERDTIAFAQRFETLGTREAIQPYAINPYRVQYQNKDPRGWEEFRQQFEGHSAEGSAAALRGVTLRRTRVPQLEAELRRMSTPLLVVTGDEDTPCLAPSLFIKHACPTASLSVLPATGHAVNLEEPDTFNRVLLDFLTLVDGGRWRPRDPRSLGRSTLSTRQGSDA
ncbi:MAG: alpha/beta fold hydrolase [bacterium]|jgi:pimeloyl-ACP methyl ester carboxylesterase|nr:alpha/beta hydrolase [Betaproteobacteria bacterium]